jgi:hypothetical protein
MLPEEVFFKINMYIHYITSLANSMYISKSRRGRDRMVVRFIITYVISDYHY